MKNEKDISSLKDEFFTNRIQTTMESLKKAGINSYLANNSKEACSVILNLIYEFLEYNKKNYTDSRRIIGFGDSQTLHEISLFEVLEDSREKLDLNIINPFLRLEDGRYAEFEKLPNGWMDDPKPYEAAYLRVMEKMRQSLLSDVFITGANAITTKGEIINIDGVGNRVAGVIFGPYKVIIVVGRNKIVDSEEEGISKIKNFTTPINNLRHAKMHSRRNKDGSYLEQDSLYQLSKLPCVKKGRCYECNASNCSRRVTMIMRSATGGSIRERIHVVFINEDLGI